MDLDIWDYFGRKKILSYNQRNKYGVLYYVFTYDIAYSLFSFFFFFFFSSAFLFLSKDKSDICISRNMVYNLTSQEDKFT